MTYLHHGNTIREYHDTAVKVEVRYGIEVLLNKDNQIIASCPSLSAVFIENHNTQDEE